MNDLTKLHLECEITSLGNRIYLLEGHEKMELGSLKKTQDNLNECRDSLAAFKETLGMTD